MTDSLSETARLTIVSLVLGLTACGSGGDTPFSPAPTATGPGMFNGAYKGTWSGGQSNGARSTGPLEFTLANGVMTGTAEPISQPPGVSTAISGTVSESGAIAWNIAAGTGGCASRFTGQITTTSSTGATATGTYTLVASPTCITNSGTWTTTRK